MTRPLLHRARTPLLLTTVGVALLTAGCTGAATPAETVTVTAASAADPTSDPSSSTAGTGTSTGSGTAAGTGSGSSGIADLVATFQSTRDAFVAYKAAWTGGDLGSDATFLQLRSEMIAARQRLDDAVDRLGDDSTLTSADVPVSAEEAVRIGTEAAGTTVVVRSIELDVEDNRIVWELDLDAANGIEHELTVDAENGTVLEHDIDD